MFIEYDEFGNFYDINCDCDLCNNCLYLDKCIALCMLATDTPMVRLETTQPLEWCNFYKKDNWFNRLIYGR